MLRRKNPAGAAVSARRRKACRSQIARRLAQLAAAVERVDAVFNEFSEARALDLVERNARAGQITHRVCERIFSRKHCGEIAGSECL